MVYGFTKQSGGAMRIESCVGEGTRVEIWLPRAPEESTAQQAPARAEDAFDGSAAGALSILLVDDHEGVRATTAALLDDLGHRVTEVGSGADVLAALRASPDAYDLVITDYAMPIVSGTELIAEARRIRPALPAIIITGYADLGAIAQRPDNVLVLGKPFKDDELKDAIRIACSDLAAAAE
jgi:CheY-like chemotaxis protein